MAFALNVNTSIYTNRILYAIMNRITASVAGSPIDVCSHETASQMIEYLANEKISSYICICNAHSIVTARRDSVFQQVVSKADFSTPDGWPVAWMMRHLGHPQQQRVDGPDLLIRCIERNESLSYFFFGGSKSTLEILVQQITKRYPNAKIAGWLSPPFRELSATEDEDIVDTINKSGADVVWVGLGCPKQEKWMHDHRGRINGVMVGVGAAFDYHAGTLKRAPKWMQRSGFEWLYRLASEPRRLWKRYLVTNTLFVLYSTAQLFRLAYKKS